MDCDPDSKLNSREKYVDDPERLQDVGQGLGVKGHARERNIFPFPLKAEPEPDSAMSVADIVVSPSWS